jgi:hypothetical protein
MIIMPPDIPTHCRECESTNLVWDQTPHKLTDVVNGRLTMHDVETLFYLGCLGCGATLAHLSPDQLTEILNQPSTRVCACTETIPATARLRIVDVAVYPRSKERAAAFLPDYRLEMDTPTGGEVCLPHGADATYAVEAAKREGWPITEHPARTPA